MRTMDRFGLGEVEVGGRRARLGLGAFGVPTRPRRGGGEGSMIGILPCVGFGAERVQIWHPAWEEKNVAIADFSLAKAEWSKSESGSGHERGWPQGGPRCLDEKTRSFATGASLFGEFTMSVGRRLPRFQTGLLILLSACAAQARAQPDKEGAFIEILKKGAPPVD